MRFLLIQHSKYSANCQKYTPTDGFLGDFVHWVANSQPKKGNLIEHVFCCPFFFTIIKQLPVLNMSYK